MTLFSFVLFTDQLQTNFNILLEMDAKHINDILPLISVGKLQLEQFKRNLELENSAENPIHYFSTKLQVCLLKS